MEDRKKKRNVDRDTVERTKGKLMKKAANKRAEKEKANVTRERKEKVTDGSARERFLEKRRLEREREKAKGTNQRKETASNGTGGIETARKRFEENRRLQGVGWRCKLVKTC